MNLNYSYILSLGSNLNEREKYISNAIDLLREAGVEIIQQTSNKHTEPEMIKDQPDFINRGLLVTSTLSPDFLLGKIKNIEEKMGRKIISRYGPREIDIDIVWWSGGKYQSKDLQIPHQWNNTRSWVREIIAELIPDEFDTGNKYQIMNVKSIKNIHDFKIKKQAGEKIVVLTAYDYSMARILAKSSVDAILVGDSLGNVVLGYSSTLKVTVENMIYHGAAVKRGAPDKFTIIDMPFMSYHTDENEAVKNAGEIISKTGADAVKLEGGEEFSGVIKKIIRAGIPVMGHLGLMPQSVLKTGGYKIQGKTLIEQQKIIAEAKILQDAGVFGIVTEMIPQELGKKLSEALEIPVIGIGAGPDTDGQVLVINDMLGLNDVHTPKFVRTYMNAVEDTIKAIENFSHDVRDKKFPDKNEYFSA